MGSSRNILIGLAAISLGLVGPAFLSFGVASAQVAASTTVQPPTPDWAKGLVIYEVATKAFTSPNGPESGTFQSLKARLPYLQKLGITAIWLTGYSLSDPHHFYNIWTQYAVIEPGKIDPSLGTPRQFRALIDEAHRRNIKVFLDVITHGLMPDSSVVKQHPDWFRGGSWGMIDYDWNGGHTDLDNWWVKVWSGYVANYGVDGFRLDVGIFRPDLWSRIRQNATALGHPIVIFIEGAPVIPGVTDFTQSENRISTGETGDLNAQYIDDIPGLFREKYSETEDFSVAIEYSDGRRAEGSTNGNGPIHVKAGEYTINRISYQPTLPAGRSERKLTVSGLADSPIKSIVVAAIGNNGPAKPRLWVYGVHGGDELSIEGHAPVVDLFLSSYFAYSPSLQLSCHDNGWEGFPSDKNPYAAAGSRATFGYSFLFTPMIPIFMAGEEFDAGFHALPDLSPDLYGGRDPGKGRWLYGSQLDWAELDRPDHRAMLANVSKMLAIRKRESSVLDAEMRGEVEPRLMGVKFQSDIDVPAPYMRWNRGVAIVVMANRNTEKDARLKLQVPLEPLGKANDGKYAVTDLWRGGNPVLLSAADLSNLAYTVQKDKSPGGGIGLLKIEPIR